MLDIDGAANRIDHAVERDEKPIAGRLYDTAMAFLDLWISQLAPENLQARQCAFLISPHEPAISGYISGQNRSKSAFDPLYRHSGTPYRMAMLAQIDPIE
jgi:hypothetical protein